jgi:tetraacyldisaccharide 4'-kinase
MEAARHYLGRGLRPAIVSRGYRRGGGTGPLLVSDGRTVLVDAREAGDEPFMMASCLEGVAVAVGARRVEAARLVLRRCGADVILLDDGFQHRALARDCDIVLWDAMRPADVARPLPLGLLREGFGGLRRASALLVTRSNLGSSQRVFLRRIKRFAPRLLIFHVGLRIDALSPLEGADESVAALRDSPVAALCGIGNPASFWRLLEVEGARLTARRAFPDHHRPSVAELEDFEREARGSGARRLLMTEKDLRNLPENWRPVDMSALVVRTRLDWGDDGGRFFAFLDEQVRRR